MLCSFCPAIFVLLLQIGYITGLTKWPDGKYGLLKPKTGCPEEWNNRDWFFSTLKDWPYHEYKGWTDKAYIFQVKEGTNPNNNSSDTLNIEGYIDSKFVLRYFCVKRKDIKQSAIKWPKGTYCIYQKKDKKLGWIKMRYYGYKKSYDTENVADFTDVWYNEMNFYFYCQTSGKKTTPISLPITKPFYLLPYGSRDCQQVQWMVATLEWIKYDTANYNNMYYKHGNVPHHEVGKDQSNTEIKMYYCYYESCNYTLNDTSGVFQSPGFPSKYPNGQLCSWRIMVPENHTLHVRFSNFSLDDIHTASGHDKLQFFKTVNGSFALNDTFHGKQHRPNLTATDDVTFVFISDEKYNSAGFRAHYVVFIAPEITTTPLATTTKLPTTTSKPTTTTKPTTTKETTTKSPQTDKPTQTNEPFKPQPCQTKTNEPTRKIPHTTLGNTSNNGESSSFKETRLFSRDMTSNIVVMVIPLVCCILVIVVVVDIVYRCRHAKNKAKTKSSNSSGHIVLDQTDITSDEPTVNTLDGRPQSRDDLDDYEDVDYTQLNEVPPPRRSSKRQECHELEPIDVDTSTVFYHVLEPPNTESGLPAKPVGNGAPEVFYHTLEPPIDSTGPAYQNPSEGNHYTLNPLYEAAENSAPFVEVNKLYDSYM